MLSAYLLALFSHFVTKILADFHVGLYGPESLEDLFKTEHTEDEEKKEEESGLKITEEEDEKKPGSRLKRPKGLERFKRRRKPVNPNSSDEESDAGKSSLYTLIFF